MSCGKFKPLPLDERAGGFGGRRAAFRFPRGVEVVDMFVVDAAAGNEVPGCDCEGGCEETGVVAGGGMSDCEG